MAFHLCPATIGHDEPTQGAARHRDPVREGQRQQAAVRHVGQGFPGSGQARGQRPCRLGARTTVAAHIGKADHEVRVGAAKSAFGQQNRKHCGIRALARPTSEHHHGGKPGRQRQDPHRLPEISQPTIAVHRAEQGKHLAGLGQRGSGRRIKESQRCRIADAEGRAIQNQAG